MIVTGNGSNKVIIDGNDLSINNKKYKGTQFFGSF
jgi:hypothetical protein